jgi:hypothetical protein
MVPVSQRAYMSWEGRCNCSAGSGSFPTSTRLTRHLVGVNPERAAPAGKRVTLRN